MSTTSKCCSALQVVEVVSGAILLGGVVALAWTLLARRAARIVDPLTEADRRITELESSLHRLQDSFGQAVQG